MDKKFQIFNDITGATKGDKDKYYVYALFEKNKTRPFYVGKGQSIRMFDHEISAKNILNMIEEGEDCDKLISAKIQKIIDNGGEIIPAIVKFGLTNEEAFAAEAALISMLNFINEGEAQEKLTNIVRGHGSTREKSIFSKDKLIKCRTINDFIDNYEILDFDFSSIRHKCVFIKINKSYNSTDSWEETYENTRGVWDISDKRRDDLEYAIALYRGICVGIYPIKGWKKAWDQSEELPFPREKDNDESVLVRYSDIEKLIEDRPDIYEKMLSSSKDPQKLLTSWRNKFYFYSDLTEELPEDLKEALNKRICNIPKENGGHKDINSRRNYLYNF